MTQSIDGFVDVSINAFMRSAVSSKSSLLVIIMASQQRKKLEKYSIEKKLEVITAIECGKKLCKVAEETGIPKSTIGTWSSKKKELREAANRGIKKSFRVRKTKNGSLDGALLEWFSQQRHNDVPLTVVECVHVH